MDEKIMCILTQLKALFATNGMSVATEIAKLLANMVDHFDKASVDPSKKNDYIDLLISILQAHKSSDNAPKT